MLAILLQFSQSAAQSRAVDWGNSAPEAFSGNRTCDGALVAQALAGQRAALGELYRRHAPVVARYAARLLARTAEAEDVVQDAFVEAFRDLQKLQDPERFGHWLMRIVTHQAHRRFRRRRLLQRLGFVSYDDACLANLVSEEASPELRSQCAQLDLALLRLAPEVRAAFILRFVEGYSLPEIAEYQACSLSTAKRRLSVGHAEVSRLVDFELPGAGSPLPHEESVGATRGATRV